MIYLDPTVVAKLVATQPETNALKAFLSEHTDTRWFTCTITEVELVRTQPAAAYDAVQHALASLDTVTVSDRLLATATRISPGAGLLDALHLAAAQTAGPRLRAFLTYDPERAAAARSAGMPITQPGIHR